MFKLSESVLNLNTHKVFDMQTWMRKCVYYVSVYT